MVFPGAEVEQRVELPRVTVVRVVGPGGEGVAGVDLSISTRGSMFVSMPGTEMRTDAKGEYRWEHGAIAGTAELLVLGPNAGRGTWPFLVETDRIIKTVQGQKVAGETGEITIQLTAAELARVGKRTVLEGKLLLADGKAAVNWQVGENVRNVGAMSIISGVLLPENTTYSYAAERLVKVGAEGGFRVAGEGDSLLVVSPEGRPFLYPLNPRMWEEGAVRKVTLRLPEVRREIRDQVVDETGEGLAGLELQVSTIRSGGRRWDYSVVGETGRRQAGRVA